MSVYIATVDQWGRIKLLQPILKALGLCPEAEVTVQVSEEAIIIKPRKTETPITATIAAMNLPVAEWETMERDLVSRYGVAQEKPALVVRYVLC